MGDGATPDGSSDGPHAVGVVGAGKIASSCHLPVLANTEGVEVAYVADVDGTRAGRLARSYDARSVTIDPDAGSVSLPACDAVVLAVPLEVRRPYLEAFGGRSIPVFAEKPFAPDPATHEAFEGLCDRIACNYLRLCFGSTRQLRALVDRAPFGRLERVHYAEGGVAGPTGRSRAATERGGGMLVEVGCHGLSQLVYVLHDWALSVEAASVAWQEGFDVDIDARLVAARGGREVAVNFEMSRVRPMETRLELQFEHATVSVDPEAPDGTVSLAGDEGAALSFAPSERWAGTFAQAAYLRWQEFLALVEGGPDAVETPTTLPEVTALVTAIHEAAGSPRDRVAPRATDGGAPR
ncbi:Gfo/Idh/MocA family protein [Halomarina litorea]|uniref:Gfo/Idh/MocA family protein n=1 Tax=Halomarina litorea TaxID=2961595 RepID=UPI0020C393CF|nr:Gfo/Idh/MocA family oxidoreductase [Halomarina sp. BCD28]